MDEAIDLLFEIREVLEEQNLVFPANLVYRIVDHTNAYIRRSKLRPTGAAHRDRLIAAALDVRS